jgi:hypothetical protein
VLSVVCEHEDTGQLIFDPHFATQGGRVFLVGTVPSNASADNWMENLPCAIAWDSVQNYVVFESMEDFQTRLNATTKKSKKPQSAPP